MGGREGKDEVRQGVQEGEVEGRQGDGDVTIDTKDPEGLGTLTVRDEGNGGMAGDENYQGRARPGEGVAGDKGNASAGGAGAGLDEDGRVGDCKAITIRGVSFGDDQEVDLLNVHQTMHEGGLRDGLSVNAGGFTMHVPGTYTKASGL